MKFYRAAPLNAIPAGHDGDIDAGLAAAAALPGDATVIAVRLADLISPARSPAGAGRTALAVAGTPRIRTGDQVAFMKVIAVAPAVVRRDGRVQAGGHPAGHARLGGIEQQLDDLLGAGVIEEIAAQATLTGKVKGKARRAMTAALAIRAILLMALMPEDYGAVMTALLGDLVLVPWHRPFQIPVPKVLGTWRASLGPAPLAALQARLLAAVGAEHRDHDYRAVCVGEPGHELRLGSIDGSLTRVPDSPANRAAFGSTGTADDSAPYPQVRDLLATDASTRAMLAVVSGPSGGPKAEAEQALLDTMLTLYPAGVFTGDRIWVLDRNFPGADRVARMLATGTHVLIRVKSDLTLNRIGGFLPDGSYYSYLTGGGSRWCLKVRVIEYQVTVEGQDVPEMFCLITDLLSHVAYPAGQLAGAYAWRWPGSETSLKEAKSVITGAGPSAGPIFRSRTPELIDQEHAAWICATELARALARTAARQAAPARKGRRAGQPVQPRQISFTAARRAALASIRSGAATASLPAAMTAAFGRGTVHTLGKRRIVIDRHRHRDRKTKTRPAFPAAGRGITTRTAAAQVSVYAPAPA